MLSLVKACLALNVTTLIAFGSQAEIGPNKGVISEHADENPTIESGKAKVLMQKSLLNLFKESYVNFV